MNRKQLTLLVLLGIVLGGLGWLAWKKQQQPYAESTAKMGGKVLPNLAVNDIEQLTITQAKGSLTVAKQDGKWVVRDRAGYPANFDTLRDLLLKFSDLKVAKPVTVGPSRLPALELVPPDKGNGTLVEFKDKSGKVLQSVLLGAKSMRESGNDMPFGGGSFPNGRYLMVGTDIATAALVTEPFTQVEPKAEDWLAKEWFKVERLKSVSVTGTNAAANWTLTRENETGAWKLADAKAGEELDASKSGSSTSALSYPSFNDVSTNSAAAAGLDKPQLTATLESFDGFTYTVKVGSKIGEDTYHFQVAVAGNFPKTRTPGKEEKPEDKERLDKEFAETLKKNEERLKTEKTYEPWIYVVSKWTVDPLMKERKDLLAEKKTEEAKPGDAAAGAVPTPSLTPPLPAPPKP